MVLIMKKIFSIIILSFFWTSYVAAEYNWKEIAKLNTPNIHLFLGGNIEKKSKDPLFERLISSIT